MWQRRDLVGNIAAALAALAFASQAHAQTSVVVEINNTPAATDDYLSWTMVPARARLVGATGNANVSLQSTPNVSLVAATNDGRLITRESSLRALPWEPAGQISLVALSGVSGTLFGVTSDGKLLVRDPGVSNWREIGTAPGVLAMAATGRQLFVVTSDKKLLVRDAVARAATFQELGPSNGAVSLAATNGRLFATTTDGKLWSRDALQQNANWQEAGRADNIATLAGSGGRLFATSRDGKLLVRDTVNQATWRSIGDATGIIALSASNDGGAVGLLPDPQGTAAPRPSLDVVLRADGAWKSFFVVGARPSNENKDVAVVAVTTAGGELGRRALMVRVRKNAEIMTDGERDRFLRAFVAAAARNNQFAKYWGVHTDAINMAHQAAFLPWHRAFLLQFERELQVEDPSVAVPYWEFDKPAPYLFSQDFIGRVEPASSDVTLVRFASSNPLSNWSLTHPSVTPLRRGRNGDTTVSRTINKNFMQNDQHGVMASAIFGPYHGTAHSHIGGLLGDIRRAPADPLFFMLHANVDRAWAYWQRRYDRFDRTKTAHYSPQGHHTSTSSMTLGNYVDDTMWPWDGINRPGEQIVITTAPVALPPNLGPGAGAVGHPQVGEMLDYLDLLNLGHAQGFAYDSVPRGVGDVVPFWP